MTGHPTPNALATAENTQRARSEEQQKAKAEVALYPTYRAAMTAQPFAGALGKLELNGLLGELTKQVTAASRGDTTRAKAILMSQAHALDAIFKPSRNTLWLRSRCRSLRQFSASP